MNTESANTKAKARGKHGKRLAIVLAAVAVVLLAAVVGGLKWHESPSFCNAICHSPMDSYVKGYYSDDAKLLVTAHKAKGYECLDCHKPKLGDQLAEAKAWVTKDFRDPIKPGMKYADSFCLNTACHDMDRSQLMESTADLNWNVHETRHGELACSTCHSMHGAPTLYCAKCHEDAQALAGDIGWGY